MSLTILTGCTEEDVQLAEERNGQLYWMILGKKVQE